MSLDTALSAVPKLLTIWAVFTACFVGLLTYRGQLTRYEDEQLFLNEQNPDAEQLQTRIVRRIEKMKPFVQIFGGAAGLITIGIIGIWVADAIRILR